METRGVLFLCVTCLSLFTGTRGGKKDIYAKIVDLVSPGEEFLTEDALLSVFEQLENRVQCSGVSCGKVRRIWRRPVHFIYVYCVYIAISDVLMTSRHIY